MPPFNQKHLMQCWRFNILHLLNNSQESIQKIATLLKPRGYLLSITPCLKEKRSLVVSMRLPLMAVLMTVGVLPKTFLKGFKIGDVDQLMHTAPFQIVQTEIMYQDMTSYFVVAQKA